MVAMDLLRRWEAVSSSGKMERRARLGFVNDTEEGRELSSIVREGRMQDGLSVMKTWKAGNLKILDGHRPITNGDSFI